MTLELPRNDKGSCIQQKTLVCKNRQGFFEMNMEHRMLNIE